MSDRVGGLAPEQSVAYSPERLVGREKEQEAIRQAIRDGVRVVYIEGGGGIGKTRLLEEAERFVGDLPFPFIVLDIVDFYDTAMHGSLALEEVLARQMQQRAGEGAVLETFFSALERYRVEAVTEDDVHAAFTEAFSAWVGERRAVLRFDTAEFLEYGQDAPEVLEECEVFGEEVPAVRWLQERLPQLERATALIAARPTRALREQLEGAYSEGLWTYLPLTTLSLEETREYFRVSEYGREVDEEMVKRIWLLSDGRPIMLSLAVDWLASGVRVDEIYDADIQELHRLKEQDGKEWGERRLGFERALVGKTRLLSTPMDAAVYYAARARKGFTAEILRRMLEELSPRRIDLTPEEAHDLLQDLARLSFVKHPHGARPDWFFLHDEMYDLLDRHVWRPDYPAYTHQAETAEFLAEQIYGQGDGKGLIASAAASVKEAETHPELLDARRQLDIFHTERLFYRLEADPADGYRLYERLDAQAIVQRRHEWDDMLRIEGLRFMRTLPERARHGGLVKGLDPESGEPIIADLVNRGCRIRWVFRFSARGDPKKGERVARKLLDMHPDWSKLWRAGVMVGQGAALRWMGHLDTIPILQEAIEMLESLDLERNPWAIRHYIATAYTYWGLRARAEGNVRQAAEVYDKARRPFEENDDRVGLARVLNNLAYVLTQQGRYTEAIGRAREAAELRRELGDAVWLGLSLNTMAIAEDRAGIYARARTHAREAISLLRHVEQTGHLRLDREMGMVYLNLGRIKRHLAERASLREIEIVRRDWQAAEKYLQEALEREGALEPYYRFEVYNQFGLLYTRWANWLALSMPGEKERYRDWMRRADDFFERANRLGIERNLRLARADNLEDWAWVFHLRRAYCEMMEDEENPGTLEQEVFERLQEADAFVREEADPSEEGSQVHYVAGSVHHQWGRAVHKFEGDISAAVRHYALSVAYYDCFSSEPVERRDRVLEHLENTLTGLPATRVRQLTDEMRHAVEERRLPARELRRWIKGTIADIALQ